MVENSEDDLARWFNFTMGVGYMVQGQLHRERLAAIVDSETCDELLSPDPNFFYLIHRSDRPSAEALPTAGVAVASEPKFLLKSWSPLFSSAPNSGGEFQNRVRRLNAEVIALRHATADTVTVLKLPIEGPNLVGDETTARLDNRAFVEGVVKLEEIHARVAEASALREVYEFNTRGTGSPEDSHYLPASYVYGALALESGTFTTNPAYGKAEAKALLPTKQVGLGGIGIRTIPPQETVEPPPPAAEPSTSVIPSPTYTERGRFAGLLARLRQLTRSGKSPLERLPPAAPKATEAPQRPLGNPRRWRDKRHRW